MGTRRSVARLSMGRRTWSDHALLHEHTSHCYATSTQRCLQSGNLESSTRTTRNALWQVPRRLHCPLCRAPARLCAPHISRTRTICAKPAANANSPTHSKSNSALLESTGRHLFSVQKREILSLQTCDGHSGRTVRTGSTRFGDVVVLTHALLWSPRRRRESVFSVLGRWEVPRTSSAHCARTAATMDTRLRVDAVLTSPRISPPSRR